MLTFLGVSALTSMMEFPFISRTADELKDKYVLLFSVARRFFLWISYKSTVPSWTVMTRPLPLVVLVNIG